MMKQKLEQLLGARVKRSGVVVWCGIVGVSVLGILSLYYSGMHGLTALIRFNHQAAAAEDVARYPVRQFEQGYDGYIYARLALDPLLSGIDEQIRRDPPSHYTDYRSRRILLSGIAYLLGGGDPWRILNIYASLNMVFWGVLWCVMLLIIKPTTVWQLLCLTAAMLASGAVDSIRLSLTDLPAACMCMAALACMQGARRGRWEILFLSCAGLLRETSLCAIGSYFDRDALRSRPVRQLMRIAAPVLICIPWFVYVNIRVYGRFTLGGQGMPISWPVCGYINVLADFIRGRPVGVLEGLLFLSVVALITQCCYLLVRAPRLNAYWRTGILFAGLLLVLHDSTIEWDTSLNRAVLPLTLCFNVLLARDDRLPVAWLLLGNISVVGGLAKLAYHAVQL